MRNCPRESLNLKKKPKKPPFPRSFTEKEKFFRSKDVRTDWGCSIYGTGFTWKLLQTSNGSSLETQISLEISSDLPHQAAKRRLCDQQAGILANFTLQHQVGKVCDERTESSKEWQSNTGACTSLMALAIANWVYIYGMSPNSQVLWVLYDFHTSWWLGWWWWFFHGFTMLISRSAATWTNWWSSWWSSRRSLETNDEREQKLSKNRTKVNSFFSGLLELPVETLGIVVEHQRLTLIFAATLASGSETVQSTWVTLWRDPKFLKVRCPVFPSLSRNARI